MKLSKKIAFVLVFIVIGSSQSKNLPKLDEPKWMAIYHEYENNKKKDARILDFLSFNTWGLPVSLKGHDQEKRFGSMADSIINIGSDIIGLQETFHPKLRHHLLSKLRHYYYIGSDYRCSKEIVPFVEMDCYGGLMTLSKYPIVHEQFFSFPQHRESSWVEKLGAKGFLWTKIDFYGTHVNIINTHLYAGDDEHSEQLRMEQMYYMHATLNSYPEINNYPTILMGDFNINHPDIKFSKAYQYITKVMKCTDSQPYIQTSDFTSDPHQNKYVQKGQRSTKLDYLFIRSTNVKVIKQQRVLDANSNPLSDHFGWAVSLKI